MQAINKMPGLQVTIFHILYSPLTLPTQKQQHTLQKISRTNENQYNNVSNWMANKNKVEKKSTERK